MSLDPEPDNEFERQGVSFKIITDDMFPQVIAKVLHLTLSLKHRAQVADFLWTHFFPDEPVGRSCEMTSPSWLVNQTYIMDSIKKGACVAAINEAGEILAVRLGVVRNRNDYFEWIFETVASYLLSFPSVCSLLPKSLKKTWIFIKLQKKIDFDVWTMFDKLGCDRIYEVIIKTSFVLQSD